MTDHTITNFVYFLKEIEKHLKILEICAEKERISIQNMHIICSTLNQMCNNWKDKIEFYSNEE